MSVMRELTAVLGLTVAFAACSFAPTPSEQPPASGGAGPGGAGGAGGVAGAGAGGGLGGIGGAAGGAGTGGGHAGAGPAGTLVDAGLLARYYLDEAADGQEPAEALDSAPDPLPLTITYAPELSYAEPSAGHRGLDWLAPSTPGRASALLDGSKIVSSLQASTTGTVELVASVARMPTTGWARLLHVGAADETGRLVLAASSLTRVSGALMNEERGVWEVDFTRLERVVLHMVFDSTLADSSDRVQLYQDGARVPMLAGGSVPQNLALDLSVGRYLVVGNREEADRGFAGRVYYAALYSVALDEAQVLNNVGVLVASDDGPS